MIPNPSKKILTARTLLKQANPQLTSQLTGKEIIETKLLNKTDQGTHQDWRDSMKISKICTKSAIRTTKDSSEPLRKESLKFTWKSVAKPSVTWTMTKLVLNSPRSSFLKKSSLSISTFSKSSVDPITLITTNKYSSLWTGFKTISWGTWKQSTPEASKPLFREIWWTISRSLIESMTLNTIFWRTATLILGMMKTKKSLSESSILSISWWRSATATFQCSKNWCKIEHSLSRMKRGKKLHWATKLDGRFQKTSRNTRSSILQSWR